MLYGCLDAITLSGYVKGWAFDDTALLHPLTVSVLAGGEQLAQGIANLYRSDLVDAGHGTGWCAFCLRLLGPNDAGRQSLSLQDASSQREICQNAAIPQVEDGELGLATLEDVILADPTVAQSVEQLRGCGRVFAAFIAAEGIDTFVRCAYIYTLGRPANTVAHALAAMQLRSGSLTPYDLLQNLCKSEEFRASPRLLMSPSEPSFAFHLR